MPLDRRDFLRQTASLAAVPAFGAQDVGRATQSVAADQPAALRAFWVDVLRRVADPVLTHLAARTLKARMPVETAPGTNPSSRRPYTHLEALGRLLAGVAPWLELSADNTAEGRLRASYGDLARQAIAAAIDPTSPDFLNFTEGTQPLVDAAFLAQAVLRAPRALGDALDETARANLVRALTSTRRILPWFNNWLLFAATVEAGLARLGAPWDRMRVDYALRQHEQWYKGDGVYGDGPEFHWDYYNSFVIQPMIVDVLDRLAGEVPAWQPLEKRMLARAKRYAAILERLISPEGTYPPIGRSLAYRFGAFQTLAQMALRHGLPPGLAPAQVRSALTAVIRRTIDAPGTFDQQGWLRIGFCGHQPSVGESYISTGSLYLCAAGLLPLGLPASDDFWTMPPQPWTSVGAWSGAPFPIDHALSGDNG
jgi:hypothetical protein